MTYRIETLNGRGLPSNVDASGYDTYLAAAEMAEQEHDGDYSVESDGALRCNACGETWPEDCRGRPDR